MPDIPVESINNRVKKLTSFYFEGPIKGSDLERAAIYTKNNKVRSSLSNAEPLLVSPSVSRGSTLFVFNKEMITSRQTKAPETSVKENRNYLVTEQDGEEDGLLLDTINIGKKLIIIYFKKIILNRSKFFLRKKISKASQKIE